MLALHTLITRNHIIDRKDPHMPHMQLPAGIRKHRQTIKFLFVRILINLETPNTHELLSQPDPDYR